MAEFKFQNIKDLDGHRLMGRRVAQSLPEMPWFVYTTREGTFVTISQKTHKPIIYGHVDSRGNLLSDGRRVTVHGNGATIYVDREDIIGLTQIDETLRTRLAEGEIHLVELNPDDSLYICNNPTLLVNIVGHSHQAFSLDQYTLERLSDSI